MNRLNLQGLNMQSLNLQGMDLTDMHEAAKAAPRPESKREYGQRMTYVVTQMLLSRSTK